MAIFNHCYLSFVRLTCGLAIVACIYFSARIAFDSTSSVGISPRELFNISILVAAAAFLAISFYVGKFNWLLTRRFKLSSLFLMFIGISVLLAMVSPPLNYFRSLDSKRAQVRNDLDHQLVRDSGLEFLANGTYESSGFLDYNHVPTAIRITSPTYVRIHDGIMIVGYGGEGFSDFGLVIHPDDRPILYGLPILNGVSYYDNK